MSAIESHRSVSINVAGERLQIRTDLSDAELNEIVHFIDELCESYSRYGLEHRQKMALLTLQLGQRFFDEKKIAHKIKVEKEQLERGIQELTALLDEVSE